MKLFDIWYKKLEETFPEIFHDKIDCGLTWVAAMETVQLWIKGNPSCGELDRFNKIIEEELKIERKQL